MKKPQTPFNHNVFINCPFDKAYEPLFHAVVFTIHLLGFRARSPKEKEDGNERLPHIIRLIRSCKYGIHDLSRIEPSLDLPRFNMPFELGIDMGFKRTGHHRYRTKNHLILEADPFQYRKFISDLSSHEIKAHNNCVADIITIARDWLNDSIKGRKRYPLPGGKLIHQEYQKFQRELPEMCLKAELQVDEITFNDYSYMVAKYVDERSRKAR